MLIKNIAHVFIFYLLGTVVFIIKSGLPYSFENWHFIHI